MKLFLKGERCFTPKCAVERRPSPPGDHSQRRRKVSEYGEHLKEKPDFYHIVHFDGHGAYQDEAVGPVGGHMLRGPIGRLVFEDDEGKDDPKDAEQLSALLREFKIPAVVLNACQSGAVGKQLEAAVATRLLQEGVSSVVAMAYSVYAVAAAEFTAAFYERLFEGKSVTDAVGAGRRRLFARDRRPSPKGKEVEEERSKR